jgi:hypothetical protein
MQIDRTNYEIYFLDYIDGNLSVDLIDEFLEFLEYNPDLKEELLSVSQSQVRLPDKKIIFSGKKDLFRNELTGSSNFEYQTIAWIEGDLNEEEELLFKKELQDDPQKQEIFDLYGKMRLQPETNITFPFKNRLLKNKKRSLWIWSGRIAAILILGLLIGILFPAKQKEIETPVASLKIQSTEPQQETASSPTMQKEIPTSQIKEKQQQPVTIHKKQTGIPKPAVTDILAQDNQPNEARVPETNEPLVMLQPFKAEPKPLQPTEIKQLLHQTYEPQHEIEYTKLTDYLAQKLLDVPKAEQITLASIARAGLQAAENISQNRFNIETGKEGRIEEISFNSRLFGFSIPIKKNK